MLSVSCPYLQDPNSVLAGSLGEQGAQTDILTDSIHRSGVGQRAGPARRVVGKLSVPALRLLPPDAYWRPDSTSVPLPISGGGRWCR